MALKKTTCANHPDRPAVGVCVITKAPICPECSTQYEGVNYSKEGLRILMERRAAADGTKKRKGRLPLVAAYALSPMFFILFYFAILWTLRVIVDITQVGDL